MRLSKLLMASLLIVPLGCGGDDEDDGGNTTGGMTTAPMTDTGGMTTPMDDDGVDDGLPTTGGMDDGLPTTGGDDTPPTDESGSGSSSGAPPTDESGSGTTGGGGNAACEAFCADYFEICGESEANDYGDVGTCESTCAGWTPAQFEDCRIPHLAMANGPESPHCSHTNIDGGGTCPAG